MSTQFDSTTGWRKKVQQALVVLAFVSMTTLITGGTTAMFGKALTAEVIAREGQTGEPGR
jgi:hypothetical protein